MLWLILRAASGASTEAERLARQGKVDEAAAAAKAAVDHDPHDLESQELYVDLLLSLGMGARAVEHARAFTARAPTDPDAWYLLGRALIDPTGSRGAYENALRLEPAHARSHMGLGALYEIQGDPNAADAAYARATTEDRSLAEAWLGRVRLALRTRRPADARLLAEQGLAAVPADPSLSLQFARLDPGRAIGTLRAAIDATPDDPTLRSALAEHLLATGASGEALAESRSALAMDPSDATASRVELFAAELADGRLDLQGLQTLLALRGTEAEAPAQALPQYGPLVARFPRSSLVLMGRASLEERLGDRVASLRDLAAAAELDPGNIEAAAACGVALLDADRPGEAEPLLSQASMARPWDARLLLARWKALVEIDRKADALKVVEPLAPLHRFDAGVQAAYAGSLADAGRAAEAYRVSKSAMMQVPDPRLVAIFIQVAPAAGHAEEAAALLDQIVAKTGNQQLAEAARRLRAAPKP